MRKIQLYSIVTVLSLLFSLNILAQNVKLDTLSKTAREKYLVNLAIEVTKTHGSGYYRPNSKAIISEVKKYTTDDTRVEISKNIGREYYEVYFPCDFTKERLEWNFTSKVCIWKDNGQPFEVFFGNGMGVNFFFKSYKKATKSNKVEQIPYQQANEVINIFDTTKIEDEFK